MAIKLGRVLTHNGELSLIKLHDLSITWFCEAPDKLNFLIDIGQYVYQPFKLAKKYGGKK